MKNFLFILQVLIIILVSGCASKPKGVYVGEKKDGTRHGQGTVTYSDGTKYVGKFESGKKHGQGTQTWSDGRRYVGVWKKNRRDGNGTMTYKDNYKFDGEWKRGRPYNGKGVYIKGPDRMEGEWKNGRLEGFGKISNNSTKVWYKSYEGNFKNGKFYGQGKMTAKKMSDDMGRNPKLAKLKGLTFIGEFKNGRPHNVKSFNDSGEQQSIVFSDGILGGF